MNISTKIQILLLNKILIQYEKIWFSRQDEKYLRKKNKKFQRKENYLKETKYISSDHSASTDEDKDKIDLFLAIRQHQTDSHSATNTV